MLAELHRPLCCMRKLRKHSGFFILSFGTFQIIIVPPIFNLEPHPKYSKMSIETAAKSLHFYLGELAIIMQLREGSKKKYSLLVGPGY